MHACSTANIKICAGTVLSETERETHSHTVRKESDWLMTLKRPPIRRSGCRGLPLDVILSDWNSSAKRRHVQEGACTAAIHTVTEETHHPSSSCSSRILHSYCSRHAGRCSILSTRGPLFQIGSQILEKIPEPNVHNFIFIKRLDLEGTWGRFDQLNRLRRHDPI